MTEIASNTASSSASPDKLSASPEGAALQSAKQANPFRNILRLATGDLISKATSFFAFVYLARMLGVSNFGVLEFAGSVLAYLLLIADCGFEMWGTREAANSSDIPGLAARVVPIRLLLASLSFVLLLAVLPLFPRYPSLRAVLVIYGLICLCPGGEPEVGFHGAAADVGRGSRAGDRAGGFRGAGGGVYP